MFTTTTQNQDHADSNEEVKTVDDTSAEKITIDMAQFIKMQECLLAQNEQIKQQDELIEQQEKLLQLQKISLETLNSNTSRQSAGDSKNSPVDAKSSISAPPAKIKEIEAKLEASKITLIELFRDKRQLEEEKIKGEHKLASMTKKIEALELMSNRSEKVCLELVVALKEKQNKLKQEQNNLKKQLQEKEAIIYEQERQVAAYKDDICKHDKVLNRLYAVMGMEAEHKQNIEKFIDGIKSIVNVVKNVEINPLFKAVCAGSDVAVSKLLELNIPLNICDEEGNSILHMAVKHGNFNILAMLLGIMEKNKIIKRKDPNDNTREIPIEGKPKVDVSMLNKKGQYALAVALEHKLITPLDIPPAIFGLAMVTPGYQFISSIIRNVSDFYQKLPTYRDKRIRFQNSWSQEYCVIVIQCFLMPRFLKAAQEAIPEFSIKNSSQIAGIFSSNRKAIEEAIRSVITEKNINKHGDIALVINYESLKTILVHLKLKFSVIVQTPEVSKQCIAIFKNRSSAVDSFKGDIDEIATKQMLEQAQEMVIDEIRNCKKQVKKVPPPSNIVEWQLAVRVAEAVIDDEQIIAHSEKKKAAALHVTVCTNKVGEKEQLYTQAMNAQTKRQVAVIESEKLKEINVLSSQLKEARAELAKAEEIKKEIDNIPVVISNAFMNYIGGSLVSCIEAHNEEVGKRGKQDSNESEKHRIFEEGKLQEKFKQLEQQLQAESKQQQRGDSKESQSSRIGSTRLISSGLSLDPAQRTIADESSIFLDGLIHLQSHLKLDLTLRSKLQQFIRETQQYLDETKATNGLSSLTSDQNRTGPSLRGAFFEASSASERKVSAESANSGLENKH